MIFRIMFICNRILVIESIVVEDFEKKSWEKFLWLCGFYRELIVLDVYFLSNVLFFCVILKILGFVCN